jgi:hypothetical protein
MIRMSVATVVAALSLAACPVALGTPVSSGGPVRSVERVRPAHGRRLSARPMRPRVRDRIRDQKSGATGRPISTTSTPARWQARARACHILATRPAGQVAVAKRSASG